MNSAKENIGQQHDQECDRRPELSDESSDKATIDHVGGNQDEREGVGGAAGPLDTEMSKDTNAAVDVEAALTQVQSSRPIHTIFGKKQKMFIILMAGLGAFFSPLTASIYFPALNAIAADLHVSAELVNLTMTTYMIFQGRNWHS